MTDIKKVLDGDTLTTDEGKVRVGFIDTPESVHKDKSKNTPEGKQASEFAKTMLPIGGSISKHSYGADHFGRNVASVKRTIGDVEVDYGLVALDQGMSQYFTEYGTHPDPETHDQYKQYFSNEVPYQFGQAESNMSQEEFNVVHARQEEFSKRYTELKDGTGTQEDFDKATAALYGDPASVAKYREKLANWNRPLDQENPNSLRGAMRIAMEDPDMRAGYNQTVRNAHLQLTPKPEQEPSFWSNASTPFSMLNSVSNSIDSDNLWGTRIHGSSMDLDASELTKDLPEQYHSAVLQEAEKYNDTSALMYKDQLIEDIANSKQFDNMEWYAQLGYGALAMVIDPLSVAASGPAVRAGAGVRSWFMSRALLSNPKGNKLMGSLSAWAVAGGIEGGIVNAPRLAGDHTYMAKEYVLDTMFDVGFGLAVGGAVEAAKPAVKYMLKVKESRKKEQVALAETVQKRAQEKQSGVRAPVEEHLQPAQVKADVAKAPRRVSETLRAQVGQQEQVPWAAVTEVSADGFKLASDTMKNVMVKDSPMRKLINSQLGLNSKNLSSEARVLADKLNADILHVVAAFPDGRVPKGVEDAITGVTFRQRTTTHNDALANILTGKTSDTVGTLGKYVEALRGQTSLWEGLDVVPVSGDDLVRYNSEVLGRTASLEDTSSLTGVIPKEISFLKDVVELNHMLRNSDDPNLKGLLEELNGMVSARIEQKELGIHKQYADTKKSWGKTVEMSPTEIMAQLKKEGLIPSTKGDKESLTRTAKARAARMAELRKHGRAAVSDEVNAIGNIRQVDTGRIAKDSFDDTDRGLESDTDGLMGFKEDIDQDLLPRGFSESDTVKAFKDPSANNLATLREALDRQVLRKLGVKRELGKKDSLLTRSRIELVKKALRKDKAAVLDRMVKAGKWENVEAVIRASHELKVNAQRQASASTEGKASTPVTKAITEDDLVDVIVNDKTDDEVMAAVVEANNKLSEESSDKVADALLDFVASGEKAAFAIARQPTGVLDYAGRIAAKITEDLGTKFQNGKLTSLEYVGSRLTEIGKGYGGRIRRIATGGLIRDVVYKDSMMQIAPQYIRAMDAYAQSKGRGAFGKMQAQQRAGADDKLVKQFNKDVFLVHEYRRQGKQLPHMDKSVLDFVDSWNKFMESNHDKLVDANIGGFTKDRKIANYIPHIWKSANLLHAVKKHGKAKVINLLTQGYLKSAHGAKSHAEAKKLAERQFEWITNLGEGKADVDQFLPVADSRALARLEIDTTVEVDGLSVLDLMDDEVIGVAIKYANRVAGWVGFSKATDGAITSKLDIDTLRENIKAEGVQKGVDTAKYLKYYDDLENLMFGRPTRGGLPEEFRQLKDLTALTSMGGLGTAQLIETGQVITRSVLSAFSSDPVVRKVLKAAQGSVQERDLLAEIQSISNITDDLEWLERQSVHLDQAEMAKVNKARQFSLFMADKATMGSAKASASRLLGKTSGYNAIRRAQSRATQASFTIDVAKHFKDGTGKMGNARMADVGLTEVDGTNEAMQAVFRNIVEYGDDGLVKKLNSDKWPKAVLEEFQFALIRDEAQQIQRTHVGELPPWMNSPVMSMIFQFRQMPIVANNKQLGRSLAFADKEAVTAVLLNTAFAGLVRYGKFAALGLGVAALTDREWREPQNDQQMDIQKYITQFGIFADASDLVLDVQRTGQRASQRTSRSGELEEWSKLAGQIPVLGLMNDYKNTLPHGQSSREQIDAAFGLLPLGNTAYGDMCHAWIQDTFGE